MIEFVEIEFFHIYIKECIACNQPNSHKKDINTKSI